MDIVWVQVGQFAEQFSGYGQQDSMELIEYVLDGLKEELSVKILIGVHPISRYFGCFLALFTYLSGLLGHVFEAFLTCRQDCNEIHGPKPYIELKEADGRADQEVAAEALAAYHARSKSRVDDLFVGLFKSVVRCPDGHCSRSSVTFDPFLSAKLSLSSSAEQRLMAINLVLAASRAKG